MSGYQTQSMYDENTTKQDLVQITSISNSYNYFLPMWENRPVTDKLGTCNGKFVHVECELCKENENVMTNTLENLDYRIDTENDLSGRTRILSKWDGSKYVPCYASNGCTKETNTTNEKTNPCDSIKPIAAPLLCDRFVNPTNMRQYSSGSEY
jgi:hypothetical protein